VKEVAFRATVDGPLTTFEVGTRLRVRRDIDNAPWVEGVVEASTEKLLVIRPDEGPPAILRATHRSTPY
jgi:hypothetical protein